MDAIVLNKAFINTLQFRRGGRNKWVDWQISAQMINGEDAINEEVSKNLQVNKRGDWNKRRGWEKHSN